MNFFQTLVSLPPMPSAQAGRRQFLSNRPASIGILLPKPGSHGRAHLTWLYPSGITERFTWQGDLQVS
jgi:hypothetical protein